MTTVTRTGGEIEIALASGERLGFDQVVLACHADERLMPRSRRVWSSWNYLASQREEQVDAASVTYWMNRLQGLKSDNKYFVTLNPLREPRPESLVAEMTYHHPVFDTDAAAAQKRLPAIQGRDRIWWRITLK